MAPCGSNCTVVAALDGGDDIHHIQLLRLHHMAGDAGRLRHAAAVHDGVRARAGADGAAGRAARVVGADVGAHGVRVRRGRGRDLPDGRLRRPDGVPRHRGHAAGHALRGHSGEGRRRRGLLRREPCRRVQPPRRGHPARAARAGRVQRHRLHGRPQPL